MLSWNPFKDVMHGLDAYLRGLRWLRQNPRYIFLLMLPMVVSFITVVAAIGVFWQHDRAILEWLLFPMPDRWYLIALYYISWALLYIALFILTFIGAILITNVIASPIYEIVSVAIEREVLGKDVPGLGFLGNLRVMVVELKKVILILSLSLVLLFIPGLNVLSTLFAAFLVGWDFYDYPLARRGWSLRQRMGFVGREFFTVMGFGLWLVIPFIQFVMGPLAVPGGTLLNLDALKRRELLLAQHSSRREI